MRYQDIIGLEHLKRHLQTTVVNGRIAHAQLMVGLTGSGVLPLALAYARSILCSGDSNRCDAQIDQIAHPDLHFAYPVANNARIKDKAVSDDYIAEWREFLKTQPYGSLADWYQAIEIEKKQSKIGVDEAKRIVSKLSLKSYEGGYKVLIIWGGADKLNTEASNKLLKLIEEPPAKTVFLLIAEDEDQIINTIKSRCQLLHIPKLNSESIANGLIERNGLEITRAQQIARQSNGDYNKAVQSINNISEDIDFEKWFVTWIRTAFAARGRKSAINDLIAWADMIAATNRETQKRFLLYCLEYFRQAMLLNYKANSAVYLTPQMPDFKLEKFAPFIEGHRIQPISEEIEKAIYHIERNGNGKVILTDLAIGLTRLIHKSA
ncbi:DNA polymerase III delta prime subunit [Nonlabens ulvanivorans]|nr:DNA polymerase III subunit delta' [Nonlabens ulvanivorans]GAK92442.1 DNA polymerase III delta prime subunit [Nonlabens ulvanivorans]